MTWISISLSKRENDVAFRDAICNSARYWRHLQQGSTSLCKIFKTCTPYSLYIQWKGLQTGKWLLTSGNDVQEVDIFITEPLKIAKSRYLMPIIWVFIIVCESFASVLNGLMLLFIDWTSRFLSFQVGMYLSLSMLPLLYVLSQHTTSLEICKPTPEWNHHV